MIYGVIYLLINKINGKLYVGQTVQTLAERFKQHAQADSLIGKGIRKYGRKNFTIEVIEECETHEQLNEREVFFGLRFSTAKPRKVTTARTAASAAGLTQPKHWSNFPFHTATKLHTKI